MRTHYTVRNRAVCDEQTQTNPQSLQYEPRTINTVQGVYVSFGFIGLRTSLKYTVTVNFQNSYDYRDN